MKLPTIHLNGTSAESLRDAAMNAWEQLGVAIRAMQEAAPHARDYYPQGDGAFSEAREQFRAHQTALEQARQAMEAIAIHCADEIDAKKARREGKP